MRTEVPDALTKLSLEDAIEAFAEAHIRCMGDLSSAATLAAIVAHSALETGHWLHMHCFDFGNEKAPADWDGLVCTFNCDETFNGPTTAQAKRLGNCVVTPKSDGRFHVVLFAGHPWAYFKAFEDAGEGAFRQLCLIVLKDRYAKAWHFCCQGDAYNFALALGNAGYYTAPDKEGYSRSVESIAKKILPACASYLAGEGHAITEQVRGFTLQQALVFETLRRGVQDGGHEEPPDEVA